LKKGPNGEEACWADQFNFFTCCLGMASSNQKHGFPHAASRLVTPSLDAIAQVVESVEETFHIEALRAMIGKSAVVLRSEHNDDGMPK
jgi:hypothetical protein